MNELIYKCHNLNRINFISNKEKNGPSKYPVNFYAFCIGIRILIECYSEQIKFFDLGIFMNSNETLFGKENNFCFLSLACLYINIHENKIKEKKMTRKIDIFCDII